VQHHVIDVADPDESYHAARFRIDALAAIDQTRGERRLPVVVGGTGLYLRALLRGLDAGPPRDPTFRREMDAVAAEGGSRVLHGRLAAVAPEAARGLHPNDRIRIIRALEVQRAGHAVASEQTGWRRTLASPRLLWIGLTRNRARLAADLGRRVVQMVAGGLLDEVRWLLDRYGDRSLPALQGIGYRQFVEVAGGRLTQAEAVRRMQRETVRYAKRQWTWFAREPEIRWLDVDATGGPEGTADAIWKLATAKGLIG
jgi:tRNA dimethylallyltransferase